MLRADLLDVLNSGEAWAFVGAGASADAGAPSWSGLVESVARDLGTFGDKTFISRFDKGDWPACFDRLEELSDRTTMETAVAPLLERDDSGAPLRPGRLHKLLAELPFAGYITTNYDGLLEDALRFDPGWTSVGNTSEEIRKVAGGTSRLVWHVHGALGMDSSRSRLILTTEDYDSVYIDEAPVLRQMQGLLAHRRLVFVGFGLADADVMHTLRILGRLANPALPIFALVPAIGRFTHADERRQLLHHYKVDVLTYPVRDGSHAACVDLVDLYASLTLRRSLNYGRALPPPKDYDPETTGLLIYNELILREHAAVPGEIKRSLVVAWLLTRLADGPCTVADATFAFAELVSVLAAQVGSGPDADRDAVLMEAVGAARERGWIVAAGTDADVLRLTDVGAGAVQDRRARAAVQSERFSSSLLTRSRALLADDSAARDVANVARAYFDECVERRALGVARAANPARFHQQEYHAVALLQGLRNFLDRVANPDEARGLVGVVTGVLSEPSADEIDHIGTSVQARFGMHLLGYDADTLRVRGEEFEHTAFLVDSNTLIPLLARSSLAHAEAVGLITTLLSLGAPMLTTKLLSDELLEHAQFAKDSVGSGLVDLSPAALEEATGRADSRSNAFLEGLLAEVARGQATPNVQRYLCDVLGISSKTLGQISSHRSEVEAMLSQLGVRQIGLSELPGYTPGTRKIVRAAADRLALRRGATYTHDRQVRAEAEAQVMVLGLRRGDLQLPTDDSLRNAYFISNTRVIDEEAGEQITMSRDSALHWLATMRPYNSEHAAAIYGGLLWELQERHVDLVPQNTIRRVFRPLLVASRDQLDEELARHRDLIESRYGGDGAVEMANTRPEAVPTVLLAYQTEQNALLNEELAATRAQLSEVQGNLEEAGKTIERTTRKLKGKNRYDRAIRRRKKK